MSNIKHRAYSLVKPLYVRRRLSAIREALIRDIGGTEDNISAQKLIILDGVISRLGIVITMEQYIRQTGIIKGHSLAPCLRHDYQTYRNSIDRALGMLGLERFEKEENLSIAELEKVVDKEMREEREKEQAKEPV